ncbi:hypothetical protein [Blastococcus montanus]|uniref:hypothetical protein n=1 Tax=Blastococcus montanus TaxID=3144973 RepID=UPI00320AD078
MPDPYALDPQGPPTPARPTTGGALRAFLWALLALSVGGNTLSSFASVPVWVSLSFGLVTAACIAGLVLVHRRAR